MKHLSHLLLRQGVLVFVALLVCEAHATSESFDTLDWSVESNQASVNAGWSVASAGDVNGDGYDDVIAGAPFYHSNRGAVFVFHGSAMGLSATPNWIRIASSSGQKLGSAVASAGDVNGDGYGDVVVGAPDIHTAYVYLGSRSGLASSPAWTVTIDGKFGSSLAAAGDVNGDGYGDLLVGAPQAQDSDLAGGGGGIVGEDFGEMPGRVWGYYGGPTGLSTLASWNYLCTSDACALGASVSAAGDVNADGFSDVILGAPGIDTSYLFYGSAEGLGEDPTVTLSLDTADYTPTAESFRFGASVAGIGDINGDGYSDVLVGAPNFGDGQAEEGGAFLYYGSESGTANIIGWLFESNQASARLGFAVGSAGDLNNDGYADLSIGTPLYNHGQSQEGVVDIFLGSATGPASEADWTLESDQATAWLGYSVANAGDVNGDACSDLIVGVPQFDNGQSDEGAVYAYYGAPNALLADAAWSFEGDASDAQLGSSVASVGDVNGDGFYDIAVSAPGGDSGIVRVFLGNETGVDEAAAWTCDAENTSSLGYIVAAAGDVNGDGYDDLMVGDPGYDGEAADVGRVSIYFGSSLGLSIFPEWTMTGSAADGHFGAAIGTAGDINGDGFDDVLVGAPNETVEGNLVGRTYLFLGDATGLGESASWARAGTQVGAAFGAAVSTAGDVDADGYADVLIGSPGFSNGQSNEGRVFLFRGDANGLNTDSIWYGESNSANMGFGAALSPAGDVNGDGYADVLIGAAYHDGDTASDGRAYIFTGDNITSLDYSAFWYTSSGAHNVLFGGAVSAAGDLNGDGLGDIVVGSSLYNDLHGGAFIYYGNSSSMEVIADDAVNGENAGDLLGAAVAGVGDVNGDGYSDILVGAPNYSNGQANEGRSLLYLGNSGLSAFATAAHAFISGTELTVSLHARSPMGVARAKLQVEVKERGEMFNGADTQLSDDWTTTARSGSELTQTISGLLAGTAYHWRARVVYDLAQMVGMHYSRWHYGGSLGDPLGIHVRTLPGELSCFVDNDGDGYGSGADIGGDCTGIGQSRLSRDCNDANVAVHPGASEVAGEGVDRDCDGKILCYVDSDGDGYGGEYTMEFSASSCDNAEHFRSMLATDCNDSNASQNPEALEVAGNDIDENCDALWACYEDIDADTFGSDVVSEVEGEPCSGEGVALSSGDCADDDAAIKPGATDIPDNTIDENCDGELACYEAGDAAAFIYFVTVGEALCPTYTIGTQDSSGGDSDASDDTPTDRESTNNESGSGQLTPLSDAIPVGCAAQTRSDHACLLLFIALAMVIQKSQRSQRLRR